MNRIIAVIPARSGSKGLPHKNIKSLCGVPLIAHTIRCAERAGIFDEIHLSTDSQEYAEIARRYGASVPFLRDSTLAGDTDTSWEVACAVLDEYGNRGKEFDAIMLLQPTSPLRIPKDIMGAFELFERSGANAVVSVCEAEHSPLWCGTLPENLSLREFIPERVLNLPRQALEVFYRVNGAIYIVRASYLSRNVNLYAENCYAYIMPKERSTDIDDEIDFMLAETVMKRFNL